MFPTYESKIIIFCAFWLTSDWIHSIGNSVHEQAGYSCLTSALKSQRKRGLFTLFISHIPNMCHYNSDKDVSANINDIYGIEVFGRSIMKNCSENVGWINIVCWHVWMEKKQNWSISSAQQTALLWVSCETVSHASLLVSTEPETPCDRSLPGPNEPHAERNVTH